MKHIIKEELNYMKYLFGYQRGKVISEQTTPVKLNPDGCQKGYYRDCNTKQCTQIPANTKIAYTQQEYDFIKKTFTDVTKFNQDYEKQVNESQLEDWNYYLKSNRTEVYWDKNHKRQTSPKYYTYTDFNDFKRKLNKGEKYPKIPNIPQNKAVIDWINKSPSDEKKLMTEYLLLPRWQTYKHLFNSLKEVMAYREYGATYPWITPDHPLLLDNMGKEVYLDSWLKTKQGKLLSNLIDKVYVSYMGEVRNGGDLHLHFKTPPTVVLACPEGTVTSGTTEPTPQPTPQPTPTPQPPPPPQPVVSTPLEPQSPDNYPSYQPHLPKRAIGYDPVGKTISPFDNLQKSDKQYGRGKFHSRRTKSDGFYTKLSKRMKDAEKYYNGYYDDNGDYVEGEIEKAERNKRRIKFLEPLTKEDKLRQEIYNKEYNEYLKTKNLTSIK